MNPVCTFLTNMIFHSVALSENADILRHEVTNSHTRESEKLKELQFSTQRASYHTLTTYQGFYITEKNISLKKNK